MTINYYSIGYIFPQNLNIGGLKKKLFILNNLEQISWFLALFILYLFLIIVLARWGIYCFIQICTGWISIVLKTFYRYLK